MHIFHSIQEIPAGFGPSVVTIGNFDGVHRGHQAVLQEMIARARALHARSIAVTFDPHPVRVLRPHIPLRLITQQEQKLAWLENSGIDAVLVLPFTRELSRLTAREFAQTFCTIRCMRSKSTREIIFVLAPMPTRMSMSCPR